MAVLWIPILGGRIDVLNWPGSHRRRSAPPPRTEERMRGTVTYDPLKLFLAEAGTSRLTPHPQATCGAAWVRAVWAVVLRKSPLC
jgi:hypothetical protein